MAVHLLNRKSQVNLGFVVSIGLLAIMVMYSTFSIVRMVPTFKYELKENNLQMDAIILGSLLFDEPGYPTSWTQGNYERVGFAYYDAFAAKTVMGCLDMNKFINANASLTYSNIQSSLGLGNDTDFRIKFENSSGTLLDVYASSPGENAPVVVIRRFLTIGNLTDKFEPVNVTLYVW